jgi:indolepyruvate ferredoxin oxidoreductase beta subunit
MKNMQVETRDSNTEISSNVDAQSLAGVVRSIMIVGVGGQGTLLASRLLGAVLLAQGFDVKVSEVHGMSQRGGSVVTYVKYGKSVASPIIREGEADYILAFELLEAARWLPFLKPDGKLIVNTQKLNPMPVVTGAEEYPADVLTALRNAGANVSALDALAPALDAGSAKAVNVVLLGALSKRMEFPEEVWLNALEKTVPPRFLELNKRAFALGRE